MTLTPFVLGIVGDSGSGKNTVADAVATLLGPERVTDVRLDDYHRFTREERAARGVTALNPIVHNAPLMQEHLELLRRGRPIRNRQYDHSDGTFGPIRTIEPREVVLVRGLLGYPSDAMREMYHLAVFLNPEPDLLFRWKLRRDVLSRGYTEAEVLKSIASHLLDAKQFVLPQAERADVVVHYELPDWEAPDAEIRTSVLLRRAAAEATRDQPLLTGLEGAVRQENGDEVWIVIDPAVTASQVDEWARSLFPTTYQPDRVGIYLDEQGETCSRPQLAVVELLIAHLAERLRCAESPELQRVG